MHTALQSQTQNVLLEQGWGELETFQGEGNGRDVSYSGNDKQFKVLRHRDNVGEVVGDEIRLFTYSANIYQTFTVCQFLC